jgi:hypothetical protein
MLACKRSLELCPAGWYSSCRTPMLNPAACSTSQHQILPPSLGGTAEPRPVELTWEEIDARSGAAGAGAGADADAGARQCDARADTEAVRDDGSAAATGVTAFIGITGMVPHKGIGRMSASPAASFKAAA